MIGAPGESGELTFFGAKGKSMSIVRRAAAGAVVAVMLGLPSAAAAAPLYTLLDLGTLNPALVLAGRTIGRRGREKRAHGGPSGLTS
jgi:hypothetical protein